MNIEIPFDRIQEFCEKWKIEEFSLFGSVLRNDYTEASDVDCLVSFSPDAEWSLFDLVDMKDELSRIFNRSVDLVLMSALRNPFRRRSILNSREVIFARSRS
jgi:uncharacterized protein